MTILQLYAGSETEDHYDDYIGNDPKTGFSVKRLSQLIWCRYIQDGNGYASLLGICEPGHIYDNDYKNGLYCDVPDRFNYQLSFDITPAKIARIKNSTDEDYITIAALGFNDALALDGNLNIWITDAGSAAVKITSPDWTAHTSTTATATGPLIFSWLENAGAASGRIYGMTCTLGPTTITGVGYVDTATLVCTQVITEAYDTADDFRPVLARDTWNIYTAYPYNGSSAVLNQYDYNGTLLASLALPVIGAHLRVWLYDNNNMLWCRGDDDDDPWVVVDTQSMVVATTIPNEGYTEIMGEPFAGRPAFWGPGASDLGIIGILPGSECAFTRFIHGRDGYDDAPALVNYNYDWLLLPQGEYQEGGVHRRYASIPGSGKLWCNAVMGVWVPDDEYNIDAYGFYEIDIATGAVLGKYHTDGWILNWGTLDSAGRLVFWVAGSGASGGPTDFTQISRCHSGTPTPSVPPDYIELSPEREYISLAYDSEENLFGLSYGAGLLSGGVGDTGGRIYAFTSVNWAAHTCTHTVKSESGKWFICFLGNAGQIAGRLYGVLWSPTTPGVAGLQHGPIDGIAWMDTTTGDVTTVITDFHTEHHWPLYTPDTTWTSAHHASDWYRYRWLAPVIGADNCIYVVYPADGADAVLSKYDEDGTLLGSVALPVKAGTIISGGYYDGVFSGGTVELLLVSSTGKVWLNSRKPFYNIKDPDADGTQFIVVDSATMTVERTFSGIVGGQDVDDNYGWYFYQGDYTYITAEYEEGRPVFFGWGNGANADDYDWSDPRASIGEFALEDCCVIDGCYDIEYVAPDASGVVKDWILVYVENKDEFWVYTRVSSTHYFRRLDATDFSVTGTITLTDWGPSYSVYDPIYNKVWSIVDDQIFRVDTVSLAEDLRVTHPISMEEIFPLTVNPLDGTPWVATGVDGSGNTFVWKIDPTDGTIAETYPFRTGYDDPAEYLITDNDGNCWFLGYTNELFRADVSSPGTVTTPYSDGAAWPFQDITYDAGRDCIWINVPLEDPDSVVPYADLSFEFRRYNIALDAIDLVITVPPHTLEMYQLFWFDNARDFLWREKFYTGPNKLIVLAGEDGTQVNIGSDEEPSTTNGENRYSFVTNKPGDNVYYVTTEGGVVKIVKYSWEMCEEEVVATAFALLGAAAPDGVTRAIPLN